MKRIVVASLTLCWAACGDGTNTLFYDLVTFKRQIGLGD